MEPNGKELTCILLHFSPTRRNGPSTESQGTMILVLS